ncbi:eukaryotic porin-domain-containing protein [Lactarius sanguifluus]|nr:eukaryotic porin-domain-containing protein [Lactarius sanguifluus]
MAAASHEKSLPPGPYTEPPTQPKKSTLFSAFSPLANASSRFSSWRTALGLPNPGSVENLQKEVKTTHLTNFIFDGARADLMKGLSMDPAFQVTHSFQLASQSAPPTYSFGALFANSKGLLQGNVDHEGNVSGRFQQNWSGSNISKVQAQLGMQAGHTMIQLEHDYSGLDYTLNGKVINPSPLDGSGIYVGSYLQSVTKKLALGIETLYQRAPDQAEVSSSYLAKLTGSDGKWIATAQFPADRCTPSNLLAQAEREGGGGGRLAGHCLRPCAVMLSPPSVRSMTCACRRSGLSWTLRAKYRQLLEQRFAPSFAFTVAGEIDHFKNAAKVGVGVMIESTSLTPEEMGMVPPPGQPHF